MPARGVSRAQDGTHRITAWQGDHSCHDFVAVSVSEGAEPDNRWVGIAAFGWSANSQVERAGRGISASAKALALSRKACREYTHA